MRLAVLFCLLLAGCSVRPPLPIPAPASIREKLLQRASAIPHKQDELKGLPVRRIVDLPWQYPIGINTTNFNWVVEASPDLESWGPIATNPGATLTVEATNPASFYRLRGTPAMLLSEALNFGVANLYGGKTDTNLWGWSEGSTTSWVYPLDLSGIAIHGQAGNQILADLMLITPQHGVSANHIFGSYLNTNKLVVFAGVDGVFYTNSVLSASVMPGEDIVIATLASNVPPVVHPLYLFPTNYDVYFPRSTGTGVDGPFANCQCIWYRNNTGKMNVCTVSWPTTTINTQLGAGNRPILGTTPFVDGYATPGDSGGPVFFVLEGKPVLAFCTEYAAPAGPFISNPYGAPSNAGWLLDNLGTNSPNWIGLDGYVRF